MLTAFHLTCNTQIAPLGIDDPLPVLSWKLRSVERGQSQMGYRILAASTPELLRAEQGDLWDSGQVHSGQSVGVRYAGYPLASCQRCHWSVKVWDARGAESDWSRPAWFEMGLLRPEDWQGKWIAAPQAQEGEPRPAPFFRKSFFVDGRPSRGRLYICGLGYHELYLNDERVSDHVLEPAFTRYDRRALYVTHDISRLLRSGENVLGVVLGNGLFNQAARDAWNFEQSPWRSDPCLLLQAHLELEGGSEVTLRSDDTWKTASGPLRFDGTRLGEVYDARLEMPGWSSHGFDDSAWTPARVVEGPRGRLSAQYLPPVRVMQVLPAQKVWKTPEGHSMVDFGQNFAGWVRLRVSGPAGTEIILRHGERIDADGRLDVKDIARIVFDGEFQTDRYILKGEGVEVYEPRFTYHGFQFVEIANYPGELEADQVEGCVVHTSFDRAGSFACSNEVINQIQAATEWAYISNFVGYPTDCPHREKNGWTGDAHLAAETGLFNFDSQLAYHKWLDDLIDEQREDGSLPGIVPTSGWGYQWGNGPCWDSACILIPWYLYLYRGDRTVLEKAYPMMRRYADYLISRSQGGLVSFGLGDWVPPFGNPEDYTAPLALLASAYFYVDLLIASQAAALVGQYEEAQQYAEWTKIIREAFNRRFFDPVSGLYSGGSQTAQSMALYAQLVEPSDRLRAARQLVTEVRQQKGRINAGIHGAKAILHALAENGFHAQAYRLVTQPQFPGWAWWLSQGATTLWECWDGAASRNHIMFGDVSAWCYKYLAGIRPDPDAPGFKAVIIRPFLAEGLEWVNSEHESPYGTISSRWQRSGQQFTLEVILPPNTSGQVYLPEARPASIYVDGAPLERAEDISFTLVRPAGVVCKVSSGRWLFEMHLI